MVCLGVHEQLFFLDQRLILENASNCFPMLGNSGLHMHLSAVIALAVLK